MRGANTMKKPYESPEMETLEFTSEDVMDNETSKVPGTVD